jgi:alcohol dehydrogenase class IV
MLMPVLEFNLPSTVARYADLGRAIAPGPTAMDDSAAAEAFLMAMRTLVAEMPYERRLRDVGVAEANLPMLATDAMKVQRLLINNPRELAYDDALAIYRQAY